MKKSLIAENGTFGGFANVERLINGWLCDGVVYQDNVIGAATVGDWVAPPHVKTRDELKAERATAVESIKVTTTAGNTFDGDEISQTRMARAIIALQATGTPSVTWVLSDNSAIQASAAELNEALALAGAAQAAVWVL